MKNRKFGIRPCATAAYYTESGSLHVLGPVYGMPRDFAPTRKQAEAKAASMGDPPLPENWREHHFASHRKWDVFRTE